MDHILRSFIFILPLFCKLMIYHLLKNGNGLTNIYSLSSLLVCCASNANLFCRSIVNCSNNILTHALQFGDIVFVSLLRWNWFTGFSSWHVLHAFVDPPASASFSAISCCLGLSRQRLHCLKCLLLSLNSSRGFTVKHVVQVLCSISVSWFISLLRLALHLTHVL